MVCCVHKKEEELSGRVKLTGVVRILQVPVGVERTLQDNLHTRLNWTFATLCRESLSL